MALPISPRDREWQPEVTAAGLYGLCINRTYVTDENFDIIEVRDQPGSSSHRAVNDVTDNIETAANQVTDSEVTTESQKLCDCDVTEDNYQQYDFDITADRNQQGDCDVTANQQVVCDVTSDRTEQDVRDVTVIGPVMMNNESSNMAHVQPIERTRLCDNGNVTSTTSSPHESDNTDGNVTPTEHILPKGSDNTNDNVTPTEPSLTHRTDNALPARDILASRVITAEDLSGTNRPFIKPTLRMTSYSPSGNNNRSEEDDASDDVNSFSTSSNGTGVHCRAPFRVTPSRAPFTVTPHALKRNSRSEEDSTDDDVDTMTAQPASRNNSRNVDDFEDLFSTFLTSSNGTGVHCKEPFIVTPGRTPFRVTPHAPGGNNNRFEEDDASEDVNAFSTSSNGTGVHCRAPFRVTPSRAPFTVTLHAPSGSNSRSEEDDASNDDVDTMTAQPASRNNSRDVDNFEDLFSTFLTSSNGAGVHCRAPFKVTPSRSPFKVTPHTPSGSSSRSEEDDASDDDVNTMTAQPASRNNSRDVDNFEDLFSTFLTSSNGAGVHCRAPFKVTPSRSPFKVTPHTPSGSNSRSEEDDASDDDVNTMTAQPASRNNSRDVDNFEDLFSTFLTSSNGTGVHCRVTPSRAPFGVTPYLPGGNNSGSEEDDSSDDVNAFLTPSTGPGVPCRAPFRVTPHPLSVENSPTPKQDDSDDDLNTVYDYISVISGPTSGGPRYHTRSPYTLTPHPPTENRRPRECCVSDPPTESRQPRERYVSRLHTSVLPSNELRHRHVTPSTRAFQVVVSRDRDTSPNLDRSSASSASERSPDSNRYSGHQLSRSTNEMSQGCRPRTRSADPTVRDTSLPSAMAAEPESGESPSDENDGQPPVSPSHHGVENPTSPNYRVRSPNHRVRGPSHRVRSPSHRLRSPRSPNHHVRSPGHCLQSPRSPNHRVQSPNHRVRSPTSSIYQVEPPTSPIHQVEPPTSPIHQVEPPTSPIHQVEIPTSPIQQVEPHTSSSDHLQVPLSPDTLYHLGLPQMWGPSRSQNTEPVDVMAPPPSYEEEESGLPSYEMAAKILEESYKNDNTLVIIKPSTLTLCRFQLYVRLSFTAIP